MKRKARLDFVQQSIGEDVLGMSDIMYLRRYLNLRKLTHWGKCTHAEADLGARRGERALGAVPMLLVLWVCRGPRAAPKRNLNFPEGCGNMISKHDFSVLSALISFGPSDSQFYFKSVIFLKAYLTQVIADS